MPEVCDCTDICKIPAGQPQPLASCRGLENQIAEAKGEAALVQRLHDALSAMLYGWEDDKVRLEGFAALKEAADWLENTMTPTPELMARATQAVLALIGVDDRVDPRAMQAVVSPETHQMAADIARAVIEAISHRDQR